MESNETHKKVRVKGKGTGTNSEKKKVQKRGHQSHDAREQAVKRVDLEKKIFHLQQLLIDSTVSQVILKNAATLLQPQHYEDIVTERAVDLCCGYPCCPNRLSPTKGHVPKYKLSVATKRVFDNSELASYCGTECLIASKLYSSQLSTVPAHLRTADDYDNIAAIKFATDLESPPEVNSVDQLSIAKDLILPYGSSEPHKLDDLQANLFIHERENIPPPSLDFNGTTPTQNPSTLPAVSPSPQNDNSTVQTLENKFSTLSVDSPTTIPAAVLSNTGPQPTKPTFKPSSMRAKRQKEKENSKKAVTFQIFQDNGNGKGKTNSTKDESQKSTADTVSLDLDDTTSEEDSGDSSLFGLADSSDEEEIILTMSPFAVVWTALQNWKTPATTKFLYGTNTTQNSNDHTPHDEPEEIENQPERFLPNNSQSSLRRRALISSVSQNLASIRSSMHLNYPIEQEVGSLISTFSMTQALPSFSPVMWRTVALLFVELIAKQSTSLRKQIPLSGKFSSQTESFLESHNIDKDQFVAFLDVFSND